MYSQIETIVNAYKTLSKIPSIVDGKLNNNGTRISSEWSVRNLDKGKSTKYQYNYLLDDNLSVVAESEFGSDVSNVLLSSVSPRESFKAVIREEKNSKNVKKQYLEVWSRAGLAHSIDLTALDIHGDVYANPEFGCLNWTQDETAIVYVAERKFKNSEPYIQRKSEDKSKPDNSGEALGKKGEKYIYRQDWGDQFNGRYFTVVVVCKLESETFTVLEGLPESWCPGQVRFTADGKSVVGVAWETEPQRLGIIYFTNRPSYIFELTLDGALKKLSQQGATSRSPRLNSRGDIVWLHRIAGGSHHACYGLKIKRATSDENSTLIDIVETELKTACNRKFHGIYLYRDSLPDRCYSSDGNRVVFSTPQKNEVSSYVVDIDSGRIVDISNTSFGAGSTTILDVQSDVILATCSNMTTPHQLYIARLPAPGKEAEIKWVRVSKPIEVPSSVASSKVEFLELEYKDSTDTVKTFTSIYFAPDVATDKKLPLIVWPHGGPHNNFMNAFSLDSALFNMLGFACLQVNYRGSSGAGQASIYFSSKNMGYGDVKDCKYATEVAVSRYPIDENKLCLFGNSYGGALVAHLSGQYPDLYKVVVSRIPPTDFASMYNSTDVPDSCSVSVGFEFNERGPASENLLLAMRRCSPIMYVHRVKAPTALILASGDRRVPPCQGLEYERRLRANGVKTRVYMYEDNHSLACQDTEMDCTINAARWLLEHLPA